MKDIAIFHFCAMCQVRPGELHYHDGLHRVERPERLNLNQLREHLAKTEFKNGDPKKVVFLSLTRLDEYD